MNILLINHYAGSLEHGMEFRPYYLAREWTKKGHKVTIVASSFSHLRNKNIDLKQNILFQQIEGIDYIWIKTNYYKGNGLKRIINMLNFVIKLLLYKNLIVKKVNPDVVIASSTYPLDIFPAYLIAKKTKARLIFEVHDLWPLSPMELGGIPAWHPYIVLMQIAENFAYKKSDKVVSILPKAYDHMVKHGMAPSKYVHIPNGIMVSDWIWDLKNVPDEHRKMLEKMKEQGEFLIGYAGAHGVANALNFLIEAAGFLRDFPVKIVLIGDGPEKDNLQSMVNRLDLNNKVFFLPRVAKASIPALLSYFDVLYIGLQKEPLFRFGVSPNKMMDYMMAGKPIINAIEAGNDPVAESGCGISVPAEDSQAIANAVVKLYQMDDKQRNVMGEKGREYVLKHHDYRVLAQRFLDIMG